MDKQTFVAIINDIDHLQAEADEITKIKIYTTKTSWLVYSDDVYITDYYIRIFYADTFIYIPYSEITTVII